MAKISYKICISIGAIGIWLIFAPAANAATMYFFPTNRTYSVGERLNVSVLLSSPNDSANAVSGVITFPSDKLQLLSFSKTDSIINLWPEEPVISNENGNFSFEGVVLNPGFRGSGGKILNLTFAAKASALADVKFSSGSILANDGKGTNILDSLGSGAYTILVAPPSTASPPKAIPQHVTVPDPTSTAATSSSLIAISPAPAPESLFTAFTKEMMRLLSVIIPMLALIILLILLLYYSWSKYHLLRKRTLKESLEAEGALTQAFKLLKTSVSDQIRTMEATQTKRKLTDEELNFLKQLKFDLSQAEIYVKKEIVDIEKLK